MQKFVAFVMLFVMCASSVSVLMSLDVASAETRIGDDPQNVNAANLWDFTVLWSEKDEGG